MRLLLGLLDRFNEVILEPVPGWRGWGFGMLGQTPSETMKDEHDSWCDIPDSTLPDPELGVKSLFFENLSFERALEVDENLSTKAFSPW